jgi:hypothetical protein
VFFTMVNKRRFGIGPKTALSVDRDPETLEKVNVLSSNLVRLYLALPSLLRTVL